MDSKKEKELAGIKWRLDYLITTAGISDSEKVAVLKSALETIEKSKVKRAVQ